MGRGIGFMIKVVSDRLRTKGDADLREMGLTFTQSAVLAYLDSRENRQATQKEIEGYLRVAHPTVVGILSRMETAGFITSWQDPEDRRHKVVQMTEAAVNVSRQLLKEVEAGEEQLTRSLTNQELDEFERILKIIYRNTGGGDLPIPPRG